MFTRSAGNFQILVRATLNKNTIKHLNADCKEIDGRTGQGYKTIRKQFCHPLTGRIIDSILCKVFVDIIVKAYQHQNETMKMEVLWETGKHSYSSACF